MAGHLASGHLASGKQDHQLVKKRDAVSAKETVLHHMGRNISWCHIYGRAACQYVLAAKNAQGDYPMGTLLHSEQVIHKITVYL